MHRFLATPLLLCVFYSESTFAYNDFARIAGGENADISQFPYQLLLEHKSKPSQFFKPICGGVVIGSSWALTAAHCVYNKSTLRIRSGTAFRKRGGNIHELLEIILHPEYKDDCEPHDIAVVKVDPKFVFGKNVKPIELAKITPPDGTKCKISGWGVIHPGGTLADVLQWVSVKILPSHICSNAYKNSFYPDMLCAGQLFGGKDACFGDSGGPLVAHGNLVGIVIWGEDCAKPEFPGVYTDVAHYQPWIVSVTKDQNNI